MYLNMNCFELNLILIVVLASVGLNEGSTSDFKINVDSIYENWVVSEQTLTVAGDCFPLACTYTDSSNNNHTVQTSFKFYDTSGEVGTVKVNIFFFSPAIIQIIHRRQNLIFLFYHNRDRVGTRTIERVIEKKKH